MKTLMVFVLNGMLSSWDVLNWQLAIIMLLLMVFILPLSSNSKVRYYSCYASYVLYVSIYAICITPYLLVRPRNIYNLTIVSKTLKHITKPIGIKWIVKNEHILANTKGAIIVANHQSILDILGMFNIWETMKLCTAVAKREILYVVPFGPVAWLAGLVYIDRRNPKAALKTIHMYSNLIHEAQAKLWVFPEGTRNKLGDRLLPFKRGAFTIAIEAKAPILPIVFSPYYFIDGKNKSFDRGHMIISILDEISTEGLTIEDTDALMDKTYKMMSAEYETLKNAIK